MGNYNKYNVIKEEFSKQSVTPTLDYEERAKRYLYKNGKTMVYFFAIVNLVLYTFSLIVNLNFIGFIIQITVAILLFRGFHWARIPVMISAMVNILIAILVIIIAGNNGAVTIIVDAFYLFIITYLIYSTAMLCFSKSAIEYFKVRRHLDI